MGKLKVLSGEDVYKILAKHDFVEVRRRESHIVMQAKVSIGTNTVPIPNHKEIKRGTLYSIIRKSKIDRSAFES